MKRSVVTIGRGHPLSADDIYAVAVDGARVLFASASKKILAKRRAQIVAYMEKQSVPAYGFNRGFGHNVDTKVHTSELAELQRSLIRSHSSGVGEPLSKEMVRAAIRKEQQSIRSKQVLLADHPVVQKAAGQLERSVSGAQPPISATV